MFAFDSEEKIDMWKYISDFSESEYILSYYVNIKKNRKYFNKHFFMKIEFCCGYHISKYTNVI